METIDTNQLSEFLLKVKTYNESYNEVVRPMGLHYNIFDVLGIQSKEDLLHSRFIADLLNPDGTHGQSNTFLNLFLCEIKAENSFDTSKVKVICELCIGPVDYDRRAGGRIDIVLQLGDDFIFIENKINANDQKYQLERYHNANESALLLYLTLDGKEAHRDSIGDLNQKDYTRISYKKNITDWLEKCLDHVKSKPTLQHILSQYLDIVKKLTHQSNNSYMEEKIVELLHNKPKLAQAVTEASKVINKIKNEVQAKFDIEMNKGRLKEEVIGTTDEGYSVIRLWSEDSDGIFWYYELWDASSNISNIDLGDKISEILKIIIEPSKVLDFNRRNGEYNCYDLGWFLAANEAKGKQLLDLGIKRLIDFYQDETEYRKFIDSLIEEESKVTEAFAKELVEKGLITPSPKSSK